MLEYYVQKEEQRKALRENHLGWVVEEAAVRYHRDGHSLRYVQHSLLLMSQFGDWLAARGTAVDVARATHGEAFLAQYVSPNRPEAPPGMTSRGPRRAAIRFAIRLIHERHPHPEKLPPVQVEVTAYQVYLHRDRGFAAGTVEQHGRQLQAFLLACFVDGAVDLSTLTSDRVHTYLDALPPTPKNCRTRAFCSVLRSYLRFAEMHGLAVEGLRAAVPMMPAPRPAPSPRIVSQNDLSQLLAGIDCDTEIGKRTYAVILFLADLGIRVGDVARLTLDDIDWRAGTVRVANHKQRCPYWLPLPVRLGEALADYLRHGRPASKSRAFFLQRAKPEWVPATTHALKSSVRHAWEWAGLAEQFNGTHILRHTAATRMKQEGVPLKSIADVLGHCALQTTAIYAQVDLPALRRVAQPWPGGAI
jgi:site-specific recombinase XerD